MEGITILIEKLASSRDVIRPTILFWTKEDPSSGSNDFIFSFLKIDLRAFRIEIVDRSSIDSKIAYHVLI
jgi:hypothetical protein